MKEAARRYDWVTFDCYGTLIDWEEGIGGAIVRAAAADGFELDRAEVLSAYAEIEPIVQAGAYRSYRDVLMETSRRVARRFDWPLAETESDFLPRSLGDWAAFPDTRPALERLATAGYRLGILSNIDTDLLALTLRRLDLTFDLRVTAQDVGAYKPAHAHFHEARRRIGDARWLHAAQSWFHDVVPAEALGIPVAWINRRSERPDPPRPAVRELPTLRELADWLAPR